MSTPANRYLLGRATCVRHLAFAALVLAAAAPATAQLYRVSPSSGTSTVLDIRGSGAIRGNDVAYDPANNVFLVVAGYGPIHGQFVNTSGAAIGPVFTIMDGSAYFGHFPRATYSPHVYGGQGGFLVTWHENSAGEAANEVHGVIVAYPAGVVSGDQTISSAADGLTFWEMPAPAAYSTASRRFLVVWTTSGWGVQGRFVDPSGAPVGSVIRIEDPGGARWPGVAWNAATDEFGVSYCRFNNSSAWAEFRRLGASNGVLSDRTSFGYTAGTYASEVAFNDATAHLVMVWSTGSGTESAAFDAGGSMLGWGLVSTSLNHSQDNLGFSFNPVTRTFLVVGHSDGPDDIGVELNSNGAANSGAEVLTGGATLGSFYPRTAANTNAGQWAVSFTMNLKAAAVQIAGTTSTNGGSSTPIGSGSSSSGSTGSSGSSGSSSGTCTTPDPFASMGGGTCVNGGWLPPGVGTGSSGSGSSSSSTCTTPDPFASMGGGTCVNGGWLPPGVGTGSSGSSSSSSSTCTTPDPFASMGGGSCVNGGWLPPGVGSGSSSSSSSSCTTVQPGTGWTCVNGGWLPPGYTGNTTGSCTTPDPFTAIGGGTCVNGGWVPRGL